MTGALPIDLILFAMVAAFLVLRLRSVLGRRTGFERQPGETAPGTAQPVPARDAELPPPAAAAMRSLPDPRSPVGQALTSIRAADPAFDPAAFLNGAEGAFRMIVQAFAAGDRETLRNLLSEELLRRLRPGDHRARTGGRNPAHRAARHQRPGHRGSGAARHGCRHHRADRLGPAEHDARQGRIGQRGCRGCDGNH